MAMDKRSKNVRMGGDSLDALSNQRRMDEAIRNKHDPYKHQDVMNYGVPQFDQ